MCVAPDDLSSCRVDAAGVPAEWVEATVAMPGQWTLVCFGVSSDPSSAVERRRAPAAELALLTSARILVVGCRDASGRPGPAAVDDGLAAYRWLLGEGCDLARTAFVAGAEDEPLAPAVLQAARDIELPVPIGGVRTELAARTIGWKSFTVPNQPATVTTNIAQELTEVFHTR